MDKKVKDTIKENEQLIRSKNWKQLWLNCSHAGFNLEDFYQLEYMLDSIEIDYAEGKEAAAFQLLKKIIKESTATNNIVYISTIFYRTNELKQMGYLQQEIYDMFHKYKNELNIKEIQDKILVLN